MVVEHVPFERLRAIARFLHRMSQLFDILPGQTARQPGIIHNKDFRAHKFRMMVSAIALKGAETSLRPASTTHLGIPYITQLSSASVMTFPPWALTHAAPSLPSSPIPVITIARV